MAGDMRAAQLDLEAAQAALKAWSTTVSTMEAHRERGCVDPHWQLSLRVAKHQQAAAARAALGARMALLTLEPTIDASIDDDFCEEPPTYVGPLPTKESSWHR